MSPFDLGGRTALVTGASRGIGLAIAHAMLDAGADVVTLQRTEPPAALAAHAEAAGRSLSFYPIDLSDGTSIAGAWAAVLARHRVDILVNNGGTVFRAPAAHFPLERFDEALAANLRAVFQLCQAFGVPMLERRAGKIVNIASLLSVQGGITVPAYAASKGGVASLTKALSNEWAGSGVNVNAVIPGYIQTSLNDALLADPVRRRQISERIPAGRWGEPADLGGAVVFLSSAAADYVHGVLLPVDGGWLGR